MKLFLNKIVIRKINLSSKIKLHKLGRVHIKNKSKIKERDNSDKNRVRFIITSQNFSKTF